MNLTKAYLHFISELKQSILKSRYQAAKKVNKEQLILYFKIGKSLTRKIEKEGWGNKVLEGISRDLQAELPGLRGFSHRNLKNMCQLFKYYSFINTIIIQKETKLIDNKSVIIGQPVAAQTYTKSISKVFFKIGYTHHLAIINKTTSLEETLFYLETCSKNQWSKEPLYTI